MKALQFELWSEERERQTIWIFPDSVSAVKEYMDRHAYGGFSEVSRIYLKTGVEFVVHGHVAEKLLLGGCDAKEV